MSLEELINEKHPELEQPLEQWINNGRMGEKFRVLLQTYRMTIESPHSAGARSNFETALWGVFMRDTARRYAKLWKAEVVVEHTRASPGGRKRS